MESNDDDFEKHDIAKSMANELRDEFPTFAFEVQCDIAHDRVRITNKVTNHVTSLSMSGMKSEEVRRKAMEDARAHASGTRARERAERRERVERLCAEYAPAIVKSKYVDGEVFCTLTGTRLKALEEAVVRHASGAKFTRALAEKRAPLRERSVEEERVEREQRKEEVKRMNEARAKANEEKRARNERKKEEKVREKAAERERRRANGGFDDAMGIWVPPASALSESESESDEVDIVRREPETRAMEDSGEDFDFDAVDDDEEEEEEQQEEDDAFEDRGIDDDALDEFIPTVVRPGSRKRAKLALERTRNSISLDVIHRPT